MKDALKKYKLLFLVSASVLVLFACKQNHGDGIPKPRAYPRVAYPQGEYIDLPATYCPFRAEIPDYVEIEQQDIFFGEKTLHPCWFDLYYPEFNCRVHCSYYEIKGENSFDKLHTDAFRLVLEHNEKANYIEDRRIKNPSGITGFSFAIDGPAASPYQFYLSDSSSHFIRGALYFNTQINSDSLAPIYDFVRKDVDHFINTFQWR